jgi:tetratricopeptide (TPR) repeat protein
VGCNRKTAAFLRGARPVRIGKNQLAKDSSAYGKAVVAFSNERYDQAVKYLNEAIKQEPRNANIYHLRGICYMVMEKEEPALKDLAKAIELNPRDPDFPQDRAKLHSKLKSYQKAIADYETSAKLDDEDWEPLNEMAWILSTCPDDKLRAGKKAIALARKGSKMSEYKDDVPVDTLAAAYAEDGQFAETVKWQKEAIKLAKDLDEPEELQKMQERLKLYQNKQPYRDKSQ